MRGIPIGRSVAPRPLGALAAIPSESTHPVNAAFFGLAFIAELKLKLLGAEAIVACGPG
jgi:hypothetical protein